MLHPRMSRTVGFFRRASLLVSLLLMLPTALSYGQGGVGSTRGLPDSASGVHTIQGRVVLSDGRRAEQGVLVRLSSNVAGSRSASTNADGTFIFNGLPAGEYRVTVDAGREHEPISKSVVIYGTTGGSAAGGRVGQTIMTELVLKVAANADPMFAGVPKEAVDAYRQGMQFVSAGEHKRAAEKFKQAITSHPKFVGALTELGGQYLKLNDAAKAAEVLKQAAELAPLIYSTRLRYGIALLNGKRNAEAESEFRQALKLNPASSTAHMYLGIALLTLSRDEKTKAFNPEKYADAQKELEAAATSGKEEVALAHRYLGGIYWSQKDHKRAADELELYLKLDPKAADAERMRASIKELRSKQ